MPLVSDPSHLPSLISLERLLQKSTLFVLSLAFPSLPLSSPFVAWFLRSNLFPLHYYLLSTATRPDHRHLKISLLNFTLNRKLASRGRGKRNWIRDRLLSAGHRAYGLSGDGLERKGEPSVSGLVYQLEGMKKMGSARRVGDGKRKVSTGEDERRKRSLIQRSR